MSLLIEAGFDHCLWDTSCCPHSHAPCSHLPGPLPPSLCSSCARLPAVPEHEVLSASKPLLVPSANHKPHLCLLFLSFQVHLVSIPHVRLLCLLHARHHSSGLTCSVFLYTPSPSDHSSCFLSPSVEMHTRGGQAFHLFGSHHQKPTRCLTVLHGSTVAFFPGFQNNEGPKVGTCVHKISRGSKRDRHGWGHLW